jgi:hypothetical protein
MKPKMRRRSWDFPSLILGENLIWGLGPDEYLSPSKRYGIKTKIVGPAIVHAEPYNTTRERKAFRHEVGEPGVWGWIGRLKGPNKSFTDVDINRGINILAHELRDLAVRQATLQCGDKQE